MRRRLLSVLPLAIAACAGGDDDLIGKNPPGSCSVALTIGADMPRTGEPLVLDR